MKNVAIVACVCFLAACVDGEDMVRDTPTSDKSGVNGDPVSIAFEAMKAKHGDEEAGIFVDKNGCKNYIADRGPELGGFVYQLVDENGAPFCE